MNTPLKLFTDPAVLARVQRNILSRFLEDSQAHLPPEASALLTVSLNGLTLEEYCSAWAAQFSSTAQFGARLLEALHAIELLALPENASMLGEALSHLPPGYVINRGFSTLHQALHLWMLAHSPAGVSWPDGEATESGGADREAASANAAPGVPIDPPHVASSHLPSPISDAGSSSHLPSPLSSAFPKAARR
jgi:hypothetical protein